MQLKADMNVGFKKNITSVCQDGNNRFALSQQVSYNLEEINIYIDTHNFKVT